MVDPMILDIERRASDAGVKMAPVLRSAGVAATTWWRWRHGGVGPRIGTVRKVSEALDRQVEGGSQQDAAA